MSIETVESTAQIFHNSDNNHVMERLELSEGYTRFVNELQLKDQQYQARTFALLAIHRRLQTPLSAEHQAELERRRAIIAPGHSELASDIATLRKQQREYMKDIRHQNGLLRWFQTDTGALESYIYRNHIYNGSEIDG